MKRTLVWLIIRGEASHQIVVVIFALALGGVCLVGCASSTLETTKPASVLRITSVRSSEDAAAVPPPEKIRSRFQLLLDEALYSDENFQRGSQLQIKWQMTAFDEGSRALRYLVGFGAGRGKIVVRAKFFDERGREVASIQSQGFIVMGAFGGSYETALSVCADEIAKYAKSHFQGTSRH